MLRDMQVEHVLCSYLKFHKSKKDPLKIFDCPQFKFIAVDSGAHTLQKGTGGFELTEFVEGYKNFVREYRDHPKILWFAELDIEENVGQRQVNVWLKQLEKITDKTMPVWHPARGPRSWESICKRFKNVGTGGKWRQLERDTLISMAVMAMDQGARHHGFGCSTTELMVDIPLFSTDSTSWLAGEQYGQVLRDDVRGQVRQRSGRALKRTDGGVIELVKKYQDRTRGMITKYKEFGEYVTELWAKRGIEFDLEAVCRELKPKGKGRKKRR